MSENNFAACQSIPEHGLSVFGLVDRNATVVEVTYGHHDEDAGTMRYTTSTGSSKREQGDVFDAQIGYELALSRALLKLSRELKSQASARLQEITQVCQAEHSFAEYSVPEIWQLAAAGKSSFWQRFYE